jgi:hypothetical protein
VGVLLLEGKRMAKRQPISKKLRFEVFKRDSFTCQYCGLKAPDVILEVDHIKPVKEGGTNDLLNLITSCYICNRGKGARELSDKTVVEKQRKQIEELNIRRQQLEMMLEWRNGLLDLKSDSINAVHNYITKKTGYELNDTGLNNITNLIDKFGVANVFEAIDIGVDKYYKNDAETFNIMMNKLGGILILKNKPPHIQQIAYIKGICRNKFDYYDARKTSIMLNNFYKDGGNLDELQELLVNDEFRNWASFRYFMEG